MRERKGKLHFTLVLTFTPGGSKTADLCETFGVFMKIKLVNRDFSQVRMTQNQLSVHLLMSKLSG